jgi:GNAT superfamily N-acetyltransferase
LNLDFKVSVVGAGNLRGALRLLEGSLRDGEPVSEEFAGRMRRAMEGGWIEVLAAGAGERVLGVVVLAYRLNVAAGGEFASIEDLYVRPEIRRRGVGRALLETVAERCAARGISYVEVQVEEGDARKFYAALGYGVEPDVSVLARSYAL